MGNSIKKSHGVYLEKTLIDRHGNITSQNNHIQNCSLVNKEHVLRRENTQENPNTILFL